MTWRARGHFKAQIHFTSAFTSASGTLALGGMGTCPQVPTLPLFTFSTSIASDFGSPRYLFATSLYAGPTSFLSIARQAVQACFFASSSLARVGVAAPARAA